MNYPVEQAAEIPYVPTDDAKRFLLRHMVRRKEWGKGNSIKSRPSTSAGALGAVDELLKLPMFQVR